MFLFYLVYFLFCLFLDRGERREKERERNINVWLPLAHPLLGTWPTTCALTGNRTSHPLVHGPVLHPLSHTSQGWDIFFRPLWGYTNNYFGNHFYYFMNVSLCFVFFTILPSSITHFIGVQSWWINICCLSTKIPAS